MNCTAKQNTFIEEYLVDFNATQAAIRAGYSAKTARVQASQNLTKLNIRAKIDEKMSERNKQILFDSYWVVENLKALVDKCMLKNDPHGAIKALHLLGKHIGMFANKSEPIEDKLPTVVKFNIIQMSE